MVSIIEQYQELLDSLKFRLGNKSGGYNTLTHSSFIDLIAEIETKINFNSFLSDELEIKKIGTVESWLRYVNSNAMFKHYKR